MFLYLHPLNSTPFEKNWSVPGYVFYVIHLPRPFYFEWLRGFIEIDYSVSLISVELILLKTLHHRGLPF
jgi:hypothetical protein